jgi:hypothetical protein
MAIGTAIDFHNVIGSKRKRRLRFLKDYWVNQVNMMPRVSFTTQSQNFLCNR